MAQHIENKKCLVITYGPVPTPQYQTVEGGGMRAWGLAKGLLANGINVTVAINNSFPQEITEHENVNLVNWGLDDSFIELINSFDSVIISYCMGDPSVFVADNLKPDIQLILDVYVPIYVEVSARESENIKQEYLNYFEDFKRHNRVLKRGDYFLCASQVQKVYYTGVLSSLGVINPRSYRESRILISPFGIHNTPAESNQNPYKELGINTSDKVVLWFGGLYPWFRIDEFLNSIKTLTEEDDSYKFVIVGGKNPFNPNPDFFKQYEKAVKFASENKLIDKQMFFVDWVDFDKRVDWYKHADFVISINQPGEENGFSWRTRVMDYVWGEIVTLTNGGDPLSEDLLTAGAAIKLEDLSAEEMVRSIKGFYRNPENAKKVSKALINQKPQYYWENVTKETARIIFSSSIPYFGELNFKSEIGYKEAESVLFSKTPNSSQGNVYFAKAKKVIKIAPKIARYAKQKGLKQSAKMGISVIQNQVKNKAMPNQKQYVFLSHPLDNSGAPQVLLQVISDLIKSKPSIRRKIRIIAPTATKNRKAEVTSMGLNIEKSAHGLNAPLTGLQLGLKQDDFVFLNTTAIFDNYRNYVFNLLEAGRLNHAFWFIHEDVAQTNVVAPQLLHKENIKKIHKLVENNLLTIFVPSKRVQEDYNKIFDTNKIKRVDLRIDVDDKYLKERDATDYETVNFLLSGSAADGRKGQFIAISAFQEYLLKYKSKDPKAYRDFSLTLVGVNNDYISDQIKSIGSAVLGNKLKVFPSIPRDEAMDLTHKCNAVICCSLNETFALYVAEGMAMGHIVFRNNSAGMEEQLIDGLNGYYIDSNDISQMAEKIEKVLNLKTSNEDLKNMGDKSVKISKKFLVQDYSKHIKL